MKKLLCLLLVFSFAISSPVATTATGHLITRAIKATKRKRVRKKGAKRATRTATRVRKATRVIRATRAKRARRTRRHRSESPVYLLMMRSWRCSSLVKILTTALRRLWYWKTMVTSRRCVVRCRSRSPVISGQPVYPVMVTIC